MFYEILKKNDNIIAYIIDFNKINDEINESSFITESYLPFQLSVFNTNNDKYILPHIHLRNIRIINDTTEFIFVLKGQIKVNFFDEEGNFIKTIFLKKNQAILQFIGGHEFFIEPNTLFFELKQGPYLGKNKDKKILSKDLR